MYGNGCAGSTASGVSTGKMRCVVDLDAARLRSSASRSSQRDDSMPAAASAGQQLVEEHRLLAGDELADAGSLISVSCWRGVRPSGVGSSMPAATWSLRAATRTWKNSSRLVEKMAQNLARSSSGIAGLARPARARGR